MWTYFNDLNQNEYPTPQELFNIALRLYDNYSTPKAGAIFMSGCQPDSSVVSIGEAWKEEEDTEPKLVPVETGDANTEQGEGEDLSGEDEGGEGPKEQKGMILAEDEKFDGDRTLMRSAVLMYEALVSKEVAQAVAEGDVGRVYEGIKVGHQLNSSFSILMGYSLCCLPLPGLRITSILATSLT